MSDTQMTNGTRTDASEATAIPMKFEVTMLPVADADHAKAFYGGLGWRLDADFPLGEGRRIVQFTPPGSPASIHFGQGVTAMTPGSLEGMLLIVDDIDAARDELISHGADVTEVWHSEPGKGPVPGRDPEGRSYFSRANVSDPDGNEWELQEITERLPGRVATDPAALAERLRETAIRHGAFEAIAPPHDWWDWYAAYMEGRRTGLAPDDASQTADDYMAEAKHVVVAPS